MYELVLSREAGKCLERATPGTRRRIIRALERVKADPLKGKRLRGELVGLFSLHIGGIACRLHGGRRGAKGLTPLAFSNAREQTRSSEHKDGPVVTQDDFGGFIAEFYDILHASLRDIESYIGYAGTRTSLGRGSSSWG
ncbi:MAG TPA: hypothetical protein VLK32_06135 [Bacillota bacterium]|nr:hypothetical protein [Bacillota bacterium]